MIAKIDKYPKVNIGNIQITKNILKDLFELLLKTCSNKIDG